MGTIATGAENACTCGVTRNATTVGAAPVPGTDTQNAQSECVPWCESPSKSLVWKCVASASIHKHNAADSAMLNRRCSRCRVVVGDGRPISVVVSEYPAHNITPKITSERACEAQPGYVARR